MSHESQIQLANQKITRDFDFDPRSRGQHPENSYILNSNTFTFNNARAPKVIKMAKEWFGEEVVDSTEYLEDLRENFDIPQWADGAKVSRNLIGTDQRFKEATRISWSDSEYATSFRAALDELGATTYLMDSPQQPELEVLVSTSLLSTGLPFPIVGEVWRDDVNCSDFIYWHFDALIHSRHFHLKSHPAPQFFLPFIFESVAFLSETDDQMLMGIGANRLEVFSADSKEDIPQLAFHSEKNHYQTVVILEADGEHFFNIWTPETVRYGYIFDEVEEISSQLLAIGVTTTSLARAADILVDGFANCRENDSENFQASCFADISIYPDGALEHFERGSFTAGPISHLVDNESFAIYSACEELAAQGVSERDEELLRVALNGYQEIMSKGSGVLLPHAMNTYVYFMQNSGGYVLGMSESERADFHDYGAKLLQYVTTLPVDLQDANAYSNLALLEIARKRYKEALAAVNAGITILREDRTHLPDSPVGNSRPSDNPWIKLELFATRAELLYRGNEKEKAKDLAAKVLEEANAIGYEGPEIKKVKWILEQK